MTYQTNPSPSLAVVQERFPHLQQQHVEMLSKIADTLADPTDFMQTAMALAESLGSSKTFTREKVIHMLSELLLSVSEADVAFVRERESEEIMTLAQPAVWARGLDPVGVPAKRKYIEDGPCPKGAIDSIGGANRGLEHQRSARGRTDHYGADEMKFMDWLGSEAWIPIKGPSGIKAVIMLGKHEADFFSKERIRSLKAYQSFAQTFYNVASLADDRIEDVELGKKVTAVLPAIASAPSPQGFWRAICTLLTCGFGYKFDRAMLFWMHNHHVPAKCEMAVGGLGTESPTWAKDREQFAMKFKSLREYIQHSLEHPTPGDSNDNSSSPDPLYRLLTNEPLYFTGDEGGKVRDLVRDNKDEEGGAIKLTDNDLWIAEIRRKRPGLFASKTGEYFLFPLMPVDSSDEPTLLGFVIVDLAYRDTPHSPGPDNPNLGIVRMVLNLLAGMWLAREKEEIYLQSLVALPDLRHSAPTLDRTVGLLVDEIKGKPWNELRIRDLVDELIPVAEQLGKAAHVVDTLRRRRFTEVVDDLPTFLQTFGPDAEARHDKLLACSVSPSEYNGGVRIHPFFLQSVLLCLVDNAVSARDPAGKKVTVTIKVREIEVPESRGNAHRIVIEVENDGPPITDDLEHVLFVYGVSKHPRRGKHHRGSGPSSARLQVQSYGGDLVLLSPNRVRFGIVLDLAGKK